MLTIVYNQTKRLRPGSNWLARHAKNITSQSGRDVVLAKIFEIIKPTNRILNQFFNWEGPFTFDKIKAGLGISTDLDLVSIDIEGNEWHVWRAMSTYNPKVVV